MSEHLILAKERTLNLPNITKNWTVREHRTVRSTSILNTSYVCTFCYTKSSKIHKKRSKFEIIHTIYLKDWNHCVFILFLNKHIAIIFSFFENCDMIYQNIEIWIYFSNVCHCVSSDACFEDIRRKLKGVQFLTLVVKHSELKHSSIVCIHYYTFLKILQLNSCR